MRLEKENYLDDQAFAEAFVRTKMKTSTKGPLMIARELKDSGVNSRDTENALTHYTKERQIENAGKYLSKKMTSGASRCSVKEQYLRASRLLIQRGFQRDVTEIVLKNYEVDDTEEWSAIQYHGDKAVRKYEKLEPWQKKNKIKQFLFRKGFQTDMIQKYVDQMDDKEK